MKSLIERILPRSLRQLKSSVAWALADARGQHGVPPAYFRMKVHGAVDVPSFLAVGESCARGLLSALERSGARASELETILDFGCGVGRTLMAMRRELPDAQLYGTDIDAAAIRWCRKHLDLATFAVNSPEPPLPYPSAHFDLIYAVSVFSHLDEDLQLRWLEELRRVAKPGATLLLSVHGPSTANILPADRREEYEQRGFCFTRSDGWADYFPGFYHTALHTRSYVERQWGEYFSVVDYIEKGMADYQDLVVLRREGAAAAPGGERRRVEPVPATTPLSPAADAVHGAGHIERLQWNGGECPLSVSGWMVVPDQEIVSFEIRVDGKRVATLEPSERVDVEEALPRLPGARGSGFHLTGARVGPARSGWSYVEVVGVTRGGVRGVIGTLYHPGAPSVLVLPPEDFRRRVFNATDAGFYRIGALRSFASFLAAIRRHAPASESSLRVLDWGAGCGRLTAAYARLAGFREVHACDIDPETTRWAAEQLRGEADFRVIDPYPPTPYETGAFDVVVAYSVMTHLDRDTQRRWLHEMRRILRPGGLFLASVHGEFAARVSFDSASYSHLLGEGIHDATMDPALDGIAPAGYYRGTFQTRAYTEREWGEVFEVLEYHERGMNNWQDLVVMRAPPATLAPPSTDGLPPAEPPAAPEPAAASPEEIVAAHWSRMAQAPAKPVSWSDSALVIRHIHRMISGDPDMGWLEYACRKYLLENGRGVARGLSLGCGNGALERGVRVLGACEVMDAYDLAPGAIEEAKKLAARDGLSGINYAVANLEEITLEEGVYDVVFASAAVHHIANLENLFANVHASLKPGGLFIMLEYVGPTQFQFSDQAVQIINDLLAILPPSLRERASQRGEHVARFERATIEHMNAVDPSEAIRSADILPLLAERFTIVEKKDFGGTLNHMLLQDIVQNFEDGSPERAALLNLLLYLETLLIEEGVLASDFSFIVARPTAFRPSAR